MKGQEILQKDWEQLELVSWGKEKLTKLKTALILPVCGKLGSKVTWKTSNPGVVTGMGRVLRPSYLEKDANVTLTAVLEYGDASLEKVFHVTVLADEPFTDPQHLTNEVFFRELDDICPQVRSVKELAQKRHFNAAKAALLDYYRSKAYPNIAEETCDLGMCYMMANGFSTLQRSDRFYKGEGAACGTDYHSVVLPLQSSGIQDGVTVTYDINAKYNECVGLCIAGSQYPDMAMRPFLEIETENGIKRYACKDSALLRSGRYKDDILGNPGELYAKTFGTFLGDDTYHSIIKFQINGIDSGIQSVKLILHVKKDKALSGEKEFYVVLFPENIWDGNRAAWSDFKWQFSNRNGIPETDPYEIQEEFDFEYSFQRVRFMHFKWIAQAYRRTKDEKLLYYMIKTMTDFIKMQGHPRTYIREEHIGSGWANDRIRRTLCGGWPRGLDAAIRIESFSEVLSVIARSRYMTPDCFSAILKYVFDACDALAFLSVTEPVSNLRQFEIVGMFKMALCLPEFSKQKAWIQKAQEVMEQMMLTVTLADGTYRETTGGYNFAVFANYVNFKRQCMENNIALSPAFDDRLHKFAVYNALLQGPNGESLQYGDQNAETITTAVYEELAGWYKDEELRFLLTCGKKGRKPDWTSYHFLESSATMLRSDWTPEATYIWLQARGGGAHGHQDDNHISLISDKRVLLTDAGIFTYTADDPYRIWGTSPVAHNTVVVNDSKQAYGRSGYTKRFHSNEIFDTVTLFSTRYDGFTFSRTLTFLKPDLIFVEDRVMPNNLEKENSYKQVWHMLPTAGIYFDESKKAMRSNFEKGTNIYIYSLDEDTTLHAEMGWYDYGYQQLTKNRFGYFMKEKVKGEVRFHTVLKIVGGK